MYVYNHRVCLGREKNIRRGDDRLSPPPAQLEPAVGHYVLSSKTVV